VTISPRKDYALARRALPAAIALVAGLGGITLAGTAQAATTTEVLRFGAGDDTYSSSKRPSYNFGTSAKLVAGTVAGDTMVTYLKFKVGTLPSGSTAKSAKVTLTRKEGKLPSTVRLAKVANTSWTESVLNAKNDPALGTLVSTVKPAADAASVTFDVSSLVKAAGTYAFAISSPVTNGKAEFAADENTTGKPSLAVTVTKTVADPPPVTPSPTPVTPTPTPTPTPPAACTVDAKLVPTCGWLWGAAAGGFSAIPRDEALKTWEKVSGSPTNIYHTYHRGDEMFPNKAEIAMARDPLNPRLLMLNWKVGYGTKWANVAAGQQDARIDKLSAYLKANYTDKFFMVLHHEPENDVNPTAGSGMAAKDYAAMFRHTANRMKANGVNNAIFVVAYMNIEKWNESPWWGDLYPGDDVVDWVAVDAYNNAQPNGYHNGDFNYMMNRTTGRTSFPGWYTWASTQHPTKPLMAAEWGIYDSSTTPNGANTAKILNTVLPQLEKMPNLKGLVYFDTAKDQAGHDIRIDATPEGLAAFKKLAADPRFRVKIA
jgi:hypothetical protein